MCNFYLLKKTSVNILINVIHFKTNQFRKAVKKSDFIADVKLINNFLSLSKNYLIYYNFFIYRNLIDYINRRK